MPTLVVPHDPRWEQAFLKEAARIEAALTGQPIALHHIGSTAVPGILAKPIIDILGVVSDPVAFDGRAGALRDLGYEPKGAHGIPGRRYFRRSGADGRRTHHLHVHAEGAAHIRRHLAVRDYLRSHPDAAAAYSALKTRLTRDGTLSRDGYQNGKGPFLEATERDALDWDRKTRPG